MSPQWPCGQRIEGFAENPGASAERNNQGTAGDDARGLFFFEITHSREASAPRGLIAFPRVARLFLSVAAARMRVLSRAVTSVHNRRKSLVRFMIHRHVYGE